ncbi:MAG: hypothetical protein ACO3RF_00875, partial [Ilumatobacteraceae bacterium]
HGNNQSYTQGLDKRPQQNHQHQYRHRQARLTRQETPKHAHRAEFLGWRIHLATKLPETPQMKEPPEIPAAPSLKRVENANL